VAASCYWWWDVYGSEPLNLLLTYSNGLEELQHFIFPFISFSFFFTFEMQHTLPQNTSS